MATEDFLKQVSQGGLSGGAVPTARPTVTTTGAPVGGDFLDRVRRGEFAQAPPSRPSRIPGFVGEVARQLDPRGRIAGIVAGPKFSGRALGVIPVPSREEAISALTFGQVKRTPTEIALESIEQRAAAGREPSAFARTAAVTAAGAAEALTDPEIVADFILAGPVFRAGGAALGFFLNKPAAAAINLVTKFQPGFRAALQKNLPTFLSGPLSEIQKQDIRVAAALEKERIAALARELGLDPTTTTPVQIALATGPKSGRAISQISAEADRTRRPGGLVTAVQAAEQRAVPSGPIPSARELARRKLAAPREDIEPIKFTNALDEISQIGKKQIVGPQQAVNEEVPAILGGPVFDREVVRWTNAMRTGTEKIGDTGPFAISIFPSGLRPISKVAEKANLGGMQKLIANANDAIELDLARLLTPAEEAWAKFGIKRGSEEAKIVWRAADGRLLPESVPDALKPAVEFARKLYLGYANEFGLGPERRIAAYAPRLRERMPEDQVMPELFAIFKKPPPARLNEPFFQKVRAEGGDPDLFVEDIVEVTRAYVMAGVRHKNLAEPLKVMSQLVKDVPMPKTTADFIKFWMGRVVGHPDMFDKWVGEGVKAGAKGTLGFMNLFPQLSRFGPAAKVKNFMQEAITMDEARLGRSALAFQMDKVYKGALAFSPGTATQNLTQSLNTFAEEPVWIATGYRDLARLTVNKDLQQILKSSRVISEDHWKRVAGLVPDQVRRRFGDRGMILFQAAEMKNRIVAFFTGYNKALSQGVGPLQAIQRGRDLSFKTQFRYDSAETPLLLQTSAGRVIGQLGQFGIRQIEFQRPFTTAGKVLRGELLDNDVKRMALYILSTEAVIQAGFVADIDLRPWMRPLVLDRDKPGIPLRFGSFSGIPIGPTIQLVTSAQEELGFGQTGQFGRTAALQFPGGRVATGVLPRTLAERTPIGRARRAFSVQPAPEQRLFPRGTLPGELLDALRER